jgi:hypothetical protein
MPLQQNPFLAAAAKTAETKMTSQHRLIQPFQIAGMGINEIMVGAAILLIERGDAEALKLAQEMLGCSDEIEMRALIRMRTALRDSIAQEDTGEQGHIRRAA